MIAQAYQHSDDRMRQSAVFAMGRSLDAERWGATVIAEMTAPEPENALRSGARRRRIGIHARRAKRWASCWTMWTKKCS